MSKRTLWTAVGLAAALLAVVFIGCESSDVIAPPDSTIVVAANPTTVILGTIPQCNSLLAQAQCGVSQIVATVRSQIGIPLPGQDVRFSTTAGQLFLDVLAPSPVVASNIPIETDDIGNAVVDLITTTTATVTATSGNTEGTLTLSTVEGNLSQITLNPDNTGDSLCAGASTTDVIDCNDEICFVAQALDTAGAGINGVTIVFSLQVISSLGGTLNGTFNPLQVPTANDGSIDGVARTKLTFNNDCGSECSVSGGGGNCTGVQVLAATQGGFQSIPIPLTVNIP